LDIAIIRAMMAAASTFETSVNFYETTRHSISEDSSLPGSLHKNRIFSVFLVEAFYTLHFLISNYPFIATLPLVTII
jgi:hypothetical protein